MLPACSLLQIKMRPNCCGRSATRVKPEMCIRDRGYPVTALVNSPSVPALRRFAEELRLAMNIELVERTNMLPVRSILRQGKILGVLADQRASGGVVCNFLGREAPSPATPAVLHLRLGSPIIPAFIVRQEEEMKHQIAFLPPLEWPSAPSHRENIVRGTTPVSYTHL